MSDDQGEGGEVVPFKSKYAADAPKCGADRSGHNPPKPPCNNPAGEGTSHPGIGHCKFHFGNTSSANRSAARIEASKLALKYGDPVDVDPGTALLQEVQRTAGIVAYLSERVSKFNLDPEKGVGDIEHGFMTIYMAERGQLAKVAKMALDAGVQNRAVEFAQQQGEQLASAIREILDGLGLSPAQREMVPEVVPRVLRQLMSADTAG